MKNRTLSILLIVQLIVIAAVIVAAKVPLDQQSNIEVINDLAYIPAVLNLVENADESIHVSIFSLTYYDNYPDSNINQLLEELLRAKDRGVDVRLIADEFPEDVEKGVEYLQNNGVEVKYDGKSQTTHTKLIIIDSDTVVVGSTNWRYYSVDRNHEANVIIHSEETAQEFEHYFNNIW